MNALMNPAASTLTMSTREIAELTGKRPADVLRDARDMLEQLGEDVLKFEGMSADAYGRPQPVLNLPKDLTLTLVAGYSVPLRHRIVTRLQELEAQVAGPALPNFGNPAEAARAWAMQYEEKQALEHQTAQGVNTLGSDRHG